MQRNRIQATDEGLGFRSQGSSQKVEGKTLKGYVLGSRA